MGKDTQKKDQKKTHWKTLKNPNFIGAYTLIEMGVQELEVTIQAFKRERVPNEKGDLVEASLLYLKDHKPLWLNTTNQQTISRVLGTPFVQDWVGHKITLFVDKVKIDGVSGLASIEDMFVEAIRVREYSTKDQAELLTQDHPKFLRIKQGISMGNVTIEQVRSKYSFDEKTEKLLTNGSLV